MTYFDDLPSLRSAMPRIACVTALVAALSSCGGSGGGTPASSQSGAIIDPVPPVAIADTGAPPSLGLPLTPASEDWALVWSDEFDGTELNPDNWAFDINCAGGGNNELQCYTDSPDNVLVQDGFLNITARQQTVTGNSGFDGFSGGTVTRQFTSGRIRTEGLQRWTFGRFEMRARVPGGQGSWPAFWMLAENSPYGLWPASGEIDIMEAINLGVDGQNSIFGTLHYGTEGNSFSNFAGSEFALPNGINPMDSFHVYALEWDEDEIRWYIDDFHYATQDRFSSGWFSQFFSNGQLVNAPPGAPFDQAQEFYLILNLAVGGTFPSSNGGGVDFSQYPQTYAIDYVRVYECSTGGPTSDCASRGPQAEFVIRLN